MESNEYPYNIGDEVITRDNRNLGTVSNIEQDRGAPGRLVVDQGRSNRTTLTIPVDTIASAADGVIHLGITEVEVTGTGGD